MYLVRMLASNLFMWSLFRSWQEYEVKLWSSFVDILSEVNCVVAVGVVV